MPQLDKYIFFNQIIYLTFFFALIYFYIRGTVIPKISTILKYRKKKAYFFNNQIEGYSKVLNFSKTLFDKKGKTYTSFLVDNVNKINASYQKESLEKLATLYEKLFTVVTGNKQAKDSIIKNKIELKRLNSLNK